MMVQKGEDLGLSLSLSFPEKRSSDNYSLGSGSVLNLNLMHNPSPFTNNNSNWMANAFPSSDRRMDNGETRSFLKGIDVNRVPCATEDQDHEAGVSSPNSTISSSVISISGKRSTDDEDRPCSRGSGNSDEDEDADNARKKLRLSKDQSVVLEETFKEHNTLNPKQKQALAKRLGLRPRQVEVWFQNRRARTKLKQTEVDCEFLKRCCDNLSEENRRLQKEVQELRALKMLSPQMYMQMSPPTTLTMCPSCERVAVPPSASLPSHTRPMPSTTPLSQMRPMTTTTFNPWAAAVPHRTTFDALHSRS